MDWKALKKRVDQTENDSIGDVIVDALFDDCNNSAEIGRHVDLVFDDCKTEAEFNMANAMLIAITGWGIERLLDRLPEDDEEVLAN